MNRYASPAVKKKLIFFQFFWKESISFTKLEMSLDTILELCEKHLSEGDYLKAAETLKVVHQKTIEPNETVEFVDPIPLRGSTEKSCDLVRVLELDGFEMADNDQEIQYLIFNVGLNVIKVRPGYALKRFLKSSLLSHHLTEIGWECFDVNTEMSYVNYCDINELSPTNENYRNYVSARVDDFIDNILAHISVKYDIVGFPDNYE